MTTKNNSIASAIVSALMREAFEEQIRKNGSNLTSFERASDGAYKAPGLEDRWHGWQLAYAGAPLEPVGETSSAPGIAGVTMALFDAKSVPPKSHVYLAPSVPSLTAHVDISQWPTSEMLTLLDSGVNLLAATGDAHTAKTVEWLGLAGTLVETLRAKEAVVVSDDVAEGSLDRIIGMTRRQLLAERNACYRLGQQDGRKSASPVRADVEAALWKVFDYGKRDYKSCTRETIEELFPKSVTEQAPEGNLVPDDAWIARAIDEEYGLRKHASSHDVLKAVVIRALSEAGQPVKGASGHTDVVVEESDVAGADAAIDSNNGAT
jgi:hypothetical protein